MYNYSALFLRDLFQKGEISASAIAESVLQRVDTFDPQIGAFLRLFPEQVMQKAKRLDAKRAQGKPLGKLSGVPVALKDNILMRGEIATCGSKFLSNYRSPFDATVTRLLEEEDALLIGKTNLDEFAMGSSTENSAYQLTRNPWDLSCSAGGSSGGSAAAVAARLCPLAFGSDTGGSIRQPAALSGVVGFKPTYGRVSRYGLIAFGSSLDQIGPLATNVADAALALEVIGKHCSCDATSLPLPPEPYLTRLGDPFISPLRIGVPWRFLEELEPSAKKNFFAALDLLKELGATIVEVDLDIFKYAVAIYYILATAEASTNLARFDGMRYGKKAKNAETVEAIYELSRQEGFGAEVKQRILLGTYVLSAGYKDAYYKKAQKVRTLMIEQCKRAFGACSLIAMPVSPFPAFPLGSIRDPLQMYLQDIYTIPANLAGLPAISIPSGFSKDKKPYGFQLMGPQRSDALTLQIAYALEKAFQVSHIVPPLFEGGD